jgi:hypothetical protein
MAMAERSRTAPAAGSPMTSCLRRFITTRSASKVVLSSVRGVSLWLTINPIACLPAVCAHTDDDSYLQILS